MNTCKDEGFTPCHNCGKTIFIRRGQDFCDPCNDYWEPTHMSGPQKTIAACAETLQRGRHILMPVQEPMSVAAFGRKLARMYPHADHAMTKLSDEPEKIEIAIRTGLAWAEDND